MVVAVHAPVQRGGRHGIETESHEAQAFPAEEALGEASLINMLCAVRSFGAV